MNELDKLIYTRLTADATLVSLVGSGRIQHAFPAEEQEAPSMIFYGQSATPGSVTGNFIQTMEFGYIFGIWSENYQAIVSRLRRLFDGYQFPVPNEFVEAGSVSAVFDWAGPDQFDDRVNSSYQEVRYRFFVVPKAQNPI